MPTAKNKTPSENDGELKAATASGGRDAVITASKKYVGWREPAC